VGKCYTQLGAEERGVIMAMKSHGQSGRAIARALGRASSSVVRELHRNGYRDPRSAHMGRPPLPYDAWRASGRAQRLQRKPRVRRKLHPSLPLWQRVRTLLAQGFSPHQVAGTLKRLYPDQPAWHVSHETIYTAIYAAPRGALRQELVALLRQHKCARRPRGQGANRRGQFADLPSIHARPPEAQARLVPGHWEGDFLKGRRNRSAVGVLVDRRTLFVILARMEGCSAHAALDGFGKALAPVPPQMRKTLTYDQGKEMALYRTLSEQAGLSIYFADPRSPWQRGICENTNGLLRQYLPKGTDLSVFTQEQLDAIAWRLNTRPRKTLDFHCPAEVFFHYCGKPDIAQQVTDELLKLMQL
jgi:IS30 family transposase